MANNDHVDVRLFFTHDCCVVVGTFLVYELMTESCGDFFIMIDLYR